MSSAGGWSGSIELRRPDAASAERLLRALSPEAAREVPRARARLTRPEPGTVRLEVTAQDTGALRAAVNTYLGWLALTERTEQVARRARGDGAR
jgi:tRNA threonylcarbamoyladenosine modification (KEOPS) complex  Pcc1 subunit